MNTKHLEFFVTVAETGSLNKAAQLLFISQPQLGKIIREMEDSIGFPLLRRTRSGVELTAEGMEFLKRAKRVLHEVSFLTDLGISDKSAVRSLAVSMTKFSHIMEAFIDVIRAHQKDEAFTHHLNEGYLESVVEDVSSGYSSIGVIHFDASERSRVISFLNSNGLEYRYLAKVPFCIVISKNHPLVLSGSAITLKSLADYPFARYTGHYEDFNYHLMTTDGMFNLNRCPRVAHLSARSSLLHLIANSDFYGIGIHTFSMQQSAYGCLSIPLQVTDKNEAVEFGYVLPWNATLTPISREFIDTLLLRLTAAHD